MILSRALPPSVRDAYSKDALSGVLGATVAGFTGPFVMVIARDRLHASAAVLGLMVAAPFAGNLFSLVWANAMEGRNKLSFVVWSMIATRAVFFGMLFATTTTTFATVVIVTSLLGTIAGPAYASVIRDIYPRRIRGRAMGYARMCTGASGMVAVFIAGPLLNWVSYRYVFSVAALVGIYSSMVFSSIKMPKPQPVEKKPTIVFFVDTLRILKYDKPFRWFALSIFTAGFGTLTVLPLYPLFQVDVLHITTTQVAIIANTSAVMTVVAFFFWGPYIDRRTPLKGAAIGVLMVTALPLTYAIASRWPGVLPPGAGWTFLLPAAAIMGVAGAGIELSYFNAVLRFSPPEQVSHYQALFMSLLGVRGILGPTVGATLIQRKLVEMHTLFFVAAALCVFSVGLQVYGARTHGVR